MKQKYFRSALTAILALEAQAAAYRQAANAHYQVGEYTKAMELQFCAYYVQDLADAVMPDVYNFEYRAYERLHWWER